MKLKSMVATSALLLAVGHAAASITTADYGAYTLSYENSTSFGDPAYSFSSGGDVAGFAWSFANGLSVVSAGGASVSNTFALPSFTITANPGWSLSGPVTGFIGNLSFTELGGGTATAAVTGTISVNGGPGYVAPALLDRTVSSSQPAYTLGYLSTTTATPAYSFNTLAFSGGSITLSGVGGSFVSISTQPQNELKVSFIAAAVPEPETYAMLLAGLGLMAMVARRRRMP